MATRKANCGNCRNDCSACSKPTRRKNPENIAPLHVRQEITRALELLKRKRGEWQVSPSFPQAAAFLMLWSRPLSEQQLVDVYKYATKIAEKAKGRSKPSGWHEDDRGYPGRDLLEFGLLGGQPGLAWAGRRIESLAMESSQPSKTTTGRAVRPGSESRVQNPRLSSAEYHARLAWYSAPVWANGVDNVESAIRHSGLTRRQILPLLPEEVSPGRLEAARFHAKVFFPADADALAASDSWAKNYLWGYIWEKVGPNVTREDYLRELIAASGLHRGALLPLLPKNRKKK